MPQIPPTVFPLSEIPTAHSTSSQHGPTAPQTAPSHFASRRSYVSAHNEVSASEEKQPKPGGRRRRAEAANTAQGGEKEAHLNEMGRLYEKILTYGTGTRYSIYIVPVALILMIPVIVGATKVSSNPAKDPKIGGIRLVWFFTWIESVWLTYWAMKLVARLIPKIFSYFAGVVSSETKKYARIFENLQDMITFFGWVVVSFVLYKVLFSTSADGNTPGGWTKQFKQVLGAILVSTIIFAIEKIFVQLVGVNYHARSFNNKIGQARRNVYLLGLLFDASRTLFPEYEKSFLEEDYIIHSHLEAFVRKGWMGQGNPNAKQENGCGHGRIFKGIGRLSNKVNFVFGNISAELTGKNVLPERAAQTIITEALEKTRSTKALAHRLWFSFVMEGNDALHLSDIQEVLGPDAHELADECFQMLDPDGNEDVSLDEMTLKLTEVSLDRKAIARSMHDVSQAIKALDNVLSAVALLLSFFALISFLDTGFSSILSTASSTLLSLSFIFSATAQEFFASCIFLFIKHPYDISDRVHIWGPEGINRLRVEQIALLYTTFKRITDLELVQVPHSVLNALWINNITRSGGLLERIDMYISFDTSLEDIEILRAEMEIFVHDAENKRDWQSEIVLRCLGVGSMDKLQIQLEVRHKSNWAVENIRANRHSKLMCALVLALRKIPILGPGGGGAPLGDRSNPTYSVAIPDEVAAASREKAAKDTNAARLHPTIWSSELKKEEPQSCRQTSQAAEGAAPLGPLSESIATGAMSSFRPSENALTDEEKENDKFNIVGTQVAVPQLPSTDTGLALKKSRTLQGRRHPGLTAPTAVSAASRQLSNDPQRAASQSGASNFDQEAQT